MNKFIIRNKINAFLKSNAKSPIIEIEFLGSGGAFDIEEKNSSVIIKTSKGNVLIDCGFTVYNELVNKNLLDNIKYIFITHMHDDHIGSLSTLIYHKYFVDKEKIMLECIPEMRDKLHQYLTDICGVMPEAYEINSNKSGDIFKDINMKITKVNTTNYHYKNFESSGFIFQTKKNDNNIFIVYSGDINIPITNIIAEEHSDIYSAFLKETSEVFIFHEATARKYPPYYPHCEFQKLLKVSKTFPNIYTYHHSKDESKIMADYQNKQRKLNLAIEKIKKELKTKTEIVKTQEQIDNLNNQAKKIIQMFKEEFKNIENDGFIYDINQIGNSLVIQEERSVNK